MSAYIESSHPSQEVLPSFTVTPLTVATPLEHGDLNNDDDDDDNDECVPDSLKAFIEAKHSAFLHARDSFFASVVPDDGTGVDTGATITTTNADDSVLLLDTSVELEPNEEEPMINFNENGPWDASSVMSSPLPSRSPPSSPLKAHVPTALPPSSPCMDIIKEEEKKEEVETKDFTLAVNENDRIMQAAKAAATTTITTARTASAVATPRRANTRSGSGDNFVTDSFSYSAAAAAAVENLSPSQNFAATNQEFSHLFNNENINSSIRRRSKPPSTIQKQQRRQLTNSSNSSNNNNHNPTTTPSPESSSRYGFLSRLTQETASSAARKGQAVPSEERSPPLPSSSLSIASVFSRLANEETASSMARHRQIKISPPPLEKSSLLLPGRKSLNKSLRPQSQSNRVLRIDTTLSPSSSSSSRTTTAPIADPVLVMTTTTTHENITIDTPTAVRSTVSQSRLMAGTVSSTARGSIRSNNNNTTCLTIHKRASPTDSTTSESQRQQVLMPAAAPQPKMYTSSNKVPGGTARPEMITTTSRRAPVKTTIDQQSETRKLERRIHSSSSLSFSSSRALTIPVTPSFLRRRNDKKKAPLPPRSEEHTRNQAASTTTTQLRQLSEPTLAQSTDTLMKGLRSDMRRSVVTTRPTKSTSSLSFPSKLTIPKTPNFATSKRHPINPQTEAVRGAADHTLAQSMDVLKRGLRSSDASSIAVASGSERYSQKQQPQPQQRRSLTIPRTPNVATTKRWGVKMSTAARLPSNNHVEQVSLANSNELLRLNLRRPTVPLMNNLMSQQRRHSVAAVYHQQSFPPRTRASITTPAPFRFQSDQRSVQAKRSDTIISTKDAQDLEEMKYQFRAKPAPKSTHSRMGVLLPNHIHHRAGSSRLAMSTSSIIATTTSGSSFYRQNLDSPLTPSSEND